MEEQEIALLVENQDEDASGNPSINKYRNRALQLLKFYDYEDGTLQEEPKKLIKKHLL
jgi:hypothetical protein